MASKCRQQKFTVSCAEAATAKHMIKVQNDLLDIEHLNTNEQAD